MNIKNINKISTITSTLLIGTLALTGSLVFGAASIVTSDNTRNINSDSPSSFEQNISIQEVSSNGLNSGGFLTIKIPSNLTLQKYLGVDANNTTYNGTTNTINVKNSTVFGTSASSPKYLVVDINTTNSSGLRPLYIFNGDNNRTAIMSVYDDNTSGRKIYLGSSNTNTAFLSRFDTLGDLTTVSGIGATDTNVTVGSIYLDATTNETVLKLAIGTNTSAFETINLTHLNLKADANLSGTSTLTFVDDTVAPLISGGWLNSKNTVQVGTLVPQPLLLKTSSSSVVPNAKISSTTAQPMADFNLTAIGNLSTDGNISITLSGAKWKTDASASQFDKTIRDGNITVNGSTLFNGTTDGNVSYSSDLTTMNIILNGTNTHLSDTSSIVIKGSTLALDTTNSTLGTSIVGTISGTGSLRDLNNSKITLANVIADGITILPTDNNTSSYVNYVGIPGKTTYIQDINISENFPDTFSNTDSLSFSLPSGYVFLTQPKWKKYSLTTPGGVEDNTTGTVIPAGYISNNTFTVNLQSSDNSIGPSIGATKIMLNLSDMKISIPSSVTSGTIIPLSITSTKTANVSSINVGKISTSTANVYERNTTVATVPVSSATAMTNGSVVFDINETYAGQLSVGNSITVKLNNGAKFSSTSSIAATTGTNSLSLLTPTFSDSNTTATYLINSASTSTGSVSISLPAIDLTSVSTPQLVTANVAGTAGVAGTISIANTNNSSKVSANTVVALANSSIDASTGIIQIDELISNGLTAGTAFKIVNMNSNVSLTGKYIVNTLNKTSLTDTTSTWSTSTTNITGTVSTTFATNDTLTVSMPTTGSFIDSIRITPQVNVSPSATSGGKITFNITDVNSSGVLPTSNVVVGYVGSLPDLTGVANSNVSIGGTLSVVPTGSLGTVTYTLSNDTSSGKITVDSNGTVKVDSNATAGTTATITATDSATSKTVSTVITVASNKLSGSLQIGSGWNLVSSPVNGSINTANLLTVASTSVSSGKPILWVMNSNGTYETIGYSGTVNPGQGVWVKSAASHTVTFDNITSASTAFNFATVVNNTQKYGTEWKLIGVSSATPLATILANGTLGWGYSAANGWCVITNNSSITTASSCANPLPAGTGLWFK